MNKIHAVIWSVSKHCWLVVSEIVSSSAGRSRRRALISKNGLAEAQTVLGPKQRLGAMSAALLSLGTVRTALIPALLTLGTLPMAVAGPGDGIYVNDGTDNGCSRVGDSGSMSGITNTACNHEAIKAGVLLMTIEEIRQDPIEAKHFGCHPQLIRDYNTWLKDHTIEAGPHAQQIRKHSQQYVAWKGKRFWKGPENLKQQPFYKQCDAEDLYDLNNAHRDFSQLVAKLAQDRKEWLAHQATLKRIEVARRTGQLILEPTPHPSMAANNYARLPTETRNLAELVLNRTPVPEASTVLFDKYVHDSLAGFYLYTRTELNIPKFKTVGYLRYRSVFSVAGSRPQDCRDPAKAPSGNVPSVGGAFQQLGNTMGR